MIDVLMIVMMFHSMYIVATARLPVAKNTIILIFNHPTHPSSRRSHCHQSQQQLSYCD